jgi:hypothetical protein
VAQAVKMAKADVICSYPIRPYTATMMELAKMVANGELDAEFVHGEGEHAQLSVVYGASACGARTFTGSSGVGVTYAFEVYSPISGARLPVQLTPDTLARLQANNVQTLELRTKPDGMYVYVNGDPLPNVVWDDALLKNATELYLQMNPAKQGDPNSQLMSQIVQLAGPFLAPVVEALQALRGVQWVVAITVVAELGDLTRFDNPRQLAADVGLIPSEYSSGRTRRQGGITKAGNGRARRALIEAAWPIDIPPKCPSTSSAASTRCHNRFKTSAGRRKCGCASAFAA